jgi:hypothetical protein
MKSTIKLFLVVVLFFSTAFAGEGDMGSGGYDGDMGSGGRTCTTAECVNTSSTNDTTSLDTTGSADEEDNSDDSILTIIQNYLNEIFG